MNMLKRIWPRSAISRVVFFLTVISFCFIGYDGTKLARSLIHWHAQIWAMSYRTSQNPDPEIPDDNKHLIFVMVDHYEHGGPKHLEHGARNNDAWCNKFKDISDRYRDDFGNRFRYTWFYPFDHHNDAIMRRLSSMAREGYGEIEMHWHLSANSGINTDNYAEKLQEAIE